MSNNEKMIKTINQKGHELYVIEYYEAQPFDCFERNGYTDYKLVTKYRLQTGEQLTSYGNGFLVNVTSEVLKII